MTNPHKGKTGLRRLINACAYSYAGLKAAYQNEAAFRQELWLALVLIPLAFYLQHGVVARLLLAGSVLLVLIVELLNSALEATVDYISLDEHPLAKRAKDIASAAVALSLVNLVLVWLLVLL